MADDEVLAVADAEQVGDVGRDAIAVAAIARPRTNPGGVGQVVVPDVVEAVVEAGLVEGALQRLPRVGGGTLNWDGPGLAVEVAALGVGFEASVVGQDVLEAPIVAAVRDPGLEVAGDAAQCDRPIDGRRTAHHLAPMQRELASVPSVGLEAPVMVAPRDPRLEQVARHVLDTGVVGPGLKQQDLDDLGPRTTEPQSPPPAEPRANDDVVVPHVVLCHAVPRFTSLAVG